MGEEKGENGRLLVTNIWASPATGPAPSPARGWPTPPSPSPPHLGGRNLEETKHWLGLEVAFHSLPILCLCLPHQLPLQHQLVAPNQLPRACHRPLCACRPHV